MTKRKQPELSALRQPASAPLLDDIRQLIVDTRVQVAAAVNAGLTLLYWHIDQRIRRAEYGEEIVPTLSAQVVPEFGEGFSSRNLARMVQFAEVFPDGEIVATLSRQSHACVGWSLGVARSAGVVTPAYCIYRFYKPQPLRTLAKSRAGSEALERETEGLQQ